MSSGPARRSLARAVMAAVMVAVPTNIPLLHVDAVEQRLSSRPTIKVSSENRTLTVSAPWARAGWTKLDVTQTGAVIVRFADGYDLEAYRADDAIARSDPGPKGKRALSRLMDKASFLGGLALGRTAVVKLPRPGIYTVLGLYTYRGGDSVTFEAGRGAEATRQRPATNGTIRAADGAPWDAPATLPHEGRLLLANHGSDFHGLILQRVEPGTEPAEYAEWLYSNEAEPDFDLPGRLETAKLSPGRRMVVDYRLPRGQYVVTCYETDPDPKSGMSHVFQNEVRMIHLR